MPQKVIEIVGESKESFAKAAEKCRGRSRKNRPRYEVGARGRIEMLLDGKKIVEYRPTTRIYFDIER
jgi:flavin-binding protein dodecin